MLEIIFKYVGAGDGIILKIKTRLKSYYGIIDANKNEGSNPVLDQLKLDGVSKIDFIFLSHNHFDHYSGLYEILEYCESQNIVINLFAITTIIDEKLLKSIVTREERLSLQKLYLKSIELDKKSIIKGRNLIRDGSSIDIGSSSIRLRILSPSLSEEEDFLKKIFNDDLKITYSSNPNLMSLITLIEYKNEYVLLTSDAEKKSLRRVGKKYMMKNFNKEIVLGQIPHHGSEKNHKKDFWRTKKHKNNTPLIISVGPNNNGHPSKVVIDDLNKLNYKVECTSLQNSQNFSKRIAVLNSFSTKTPIKSNNYKDKRYMVF